MEDNPTGAVRSAETPGRFDRPEDRGISDLVKDLGEQTATLVRQELELARAELTEKGKHVGVGAGMFGGAGILGVFAFAVITAGFVMLLGTAIADWLAAFIVAAVYAAVAGALALTGRSQVQQGTPPIPEQATESVKEDVAWTKSRAKAARQ